MVTRYKTEIVGRLNLLIKPGDWLIQFEVRESRERYIALNIVSLYAFG